MNRRTFLGFLAATANWPWLRNLAPQPRQETETAEGFGFPLSFPTAFEATSAAPRPAALDLVWRIFFPVVQR